MPYKLLTINYKLFLMALKINLTSGSVFAGNPITFTITHPSIGLL